MKTLRDLIKKILKEEYNTLEVSKDNLLVVDNELTTKALKVLDTFLLIKLEPKDFYILKQNDETIYFITKNPILPSQIHRNTNNNSINNLLKNLKANDIFNVFIKYEIDDNTISYYLIKTNKHDKSNDMSVLLKSA